ncbi:peroxiredoxin-like family protein [Pseudosulfitobacter pseudonitzschiae]|uniref:peroxiredoxin-like family protein n=1 Tax=Pseudosulfitobacter pseudonitzschiae TaxID=1402135 RepID=UPI001AFAC702|nr:peroxiredoxin-like family protein [Pseudosulfitobacter pseudonitzschiae]MBM1815418.1 AhpC/TSA family protein [Pseudosulfitobacter pseudonitzschiae]MBM1832409.1 AhpC/TSA family protein [Pseudosulfitobacter pseudonitzschiae]MBM1837277.1 AhpC/TSA family protein [Pseudosulfitobacter pseudonitzschiae]MBM1842123.1 AhpC/TSA family protein [Pseudosulfitobacter pseudonitzschiae]MBM1846991.1 AhpC/TSA family protein [Pseudosulfitobacter pseudonitzschiae]
MNTLDAGMPFPQIQMNTVGGGTRTLGKAHNGHDWQLVVVYRGLHCPICKRYLSQLQEMASAFYDQKVEVIVVSADPLEKAQKMVEEQALELPVAYDLSPEQMAQLGLYISDPRSPQETDRPFAEPGTFLVNGDGNLQIVDVSNAPFARPDLDALLRGITFVREKDYPVRGTRAHP